MLVGALLPIMAAVIAGLAVNFFSIALLLPFLPANIILAALGLIFLAVGAGLWSLRPWAWWVNLVWYGILFLASVWSLADNALGAIVSVAIYGVICLYLFTVKDEFK